MRPTKERTADSRVVPQIYVCMTSKRGHVWEGYVDTSQGQGHSSQRCKACGCPRGQYEDWKSEQERQLAERIQVEMEAAEAREAVQAANTAVNHSEANQAAQASK